ncbi:DUF1559 domain-containing protein [Fimbriiglobus ruber]|uniref:Uncharacterized protein n=1 Tax=Fimbriiglobus ruber TaxID=1908690 RepID=A0A225DNL9_9BACT|nr:DUF1559 domain-containing protein [Fimbriiglobus ruber]OWK36331.1 hypothetical protein FRUB_08894 [Fimbriiglobus ruber]OWK42911.1 hypothetical protein FRUB_02508 [Fimbriiglobus ruber]
MHDERDDTTSVNPSNRIATAALVFGVLGFGGGLTAIPAVVCGAIGLTRAGHRNGSGKGMAFAGLILGAVGVLLLLLPSVIKVHRPSALGGSKNKIKQITIGLHAYHDTYAGFPGPYVLPPAGQAPPASSGRLSWRVPLLPYVEQQSLYNRINLAEAWDGPTNGPVTRTPVPTYYDSRGADVEPTNQTPYRVFVGSGAIFEENKPGKKYADVADGTSNTILMAESECFVPWAQYNELPFDPDGPLPPLGARHGDVFLAGMADGSVRAVKKSISPQVLKAAITANGGEQLPPDW